MVLNRRKNIPTPKKLTRRFGSSYIESSDKPDRIFSDPRGANSHNSNGNGSDGKLTIKQRMFISEYIIDYNATRAAVAAGYAAETAGIYANSLLKRPAVENAIQEKLKQLEKAAEITREKVLVEFAKLAFVDPQKFYDENGNLKSIPELDKDTAAALTGFDVSTTYINGEEQISVLKKIKFADKKASLDSLAKHLGMFIERQEISGPNGQPIPMKMVHSLDEFRKMFPIPEDGPRLVNVKQLKQVNES